MKHTSSAANSTGVVRPSRRMLSLFEIYLRWYVGRHFHALRIAHSNRFPKESQALIVYLNHASWWDPIACIALARQWMPHADHYAPMDAGALRQYRFMRKLGLFPIESGTRRGAAQFLKDAKLVLATPDSVLWITPEGRFTDVRTRPVVFRPGLAALVARLPACTVLPIAIEYTYWDTRLPEILACCGKPIAISETRLSLDLDWNARLTTAMSATQDELAALAVQRDASNFETLISGTAGINGIYDAYLRARARRYRAEHESISRV